MNLEADKHETLAVLNSFYINVDEKNAEGIASLCADDIDWLIPVSEVLPWTGQLNNRVDIAKALTLLFDAHMDSEEQVEPGYVFVEGSEAAVFGVMIRIPFATGKTFTNQFCQRFTVKNGKITKFLMLEDVHEVERSFE
ncbi:hypothetical protein SAMN05421821_101301 [Mucilaginibacter lappiensis]|nr:hypothetical protein SAMN05421821_101301 [Mucilaginibacter lappiensis]